MTWRCFATLHADGVRIVPLALSAHATSEEKSAVAAVASVVAAAASMVAAVASVTSWLLFTGGGVMTRSTEGDEARAFFLSSKDDFEFASSCVSSPVFGKALPSLVGYP
jgi:hypothetical protein